MRAAILLPVSSTFQAFCDAEMLRWKTVRFELEIGSGSRYEPSPTRIKPVCARPFHYRTAAKNLEDFRKDRANERTMAHAIWLSGRTKVWPGVKAEQRARTALL